jgi:thiamine-phosphate pyrophosphorylase
MLLYYITDRAQFPGNEAQRRRRLLEKIAEAARCAVDYIQLREKDLSAVELETLACQAAQTIHESVPLRTGNRQQVTALLINSRTDIAFAAGAAGVHLRSDDISPAEARKIWQQCGAGAPSTPLRAGPARQNLKP